MERLQKVMAHAGVASRRESEAIIEAGRVRVNGELVTELGTKVSPKDVVEVDGQLIEAENKVYYILNKPAHVISAVTDDRNRPTVVDLLTGVKERIYPVGRLDGDTTGLLILTNDGDLAYQLTHPKFEVEKVYRAEVRGQIGQSQLKKLETGIVIDGKKTAPGRAKLIKASKDKSQVRLAIHEGRYHQVKLMFEAVGHPVLKLHRETFGPLILGELEIGDYRELTKEEVASLKKLNHN